MLAHLQTSLHDKALLLVLDSFEHLRPAAPLVADLLATWPHLKMLITSRPALHLRGEHDLLVPPEAALPGVNAVVVAEVARLLNVPTAPVAVVIGSVNL